MKLSVTDMDCLYSNSSEVDRLNIYFHLQNEYIYLKNSNCMKEAAHICYLISYYIFVPLTPPHSEEIAMEYAKKALSLHDTQEYREWIEYVEKGN